MEKLLIYASQESHELDSKYLKRLLVKARAKNSKRNITGMLIYKEHEFIQALEGDEEEVDKLYSIIKTDPNHKNLTILSNKRIVERSFSAWSMGFSAITNDEIKDIDGFVELDQISFLSEAFRQNATAFNLLSMFAQKQTKLLG